MLMIFSGCKEKPEIKERRLTSLDLSREQHKQICRSSFEVICDHLSDKKTMTADNVIYDKV